MPIFGYWMHVCKQGTGQLWSRMCRLPGCVCVTDSGAWNPARRRLESNKLAQESSLAEAAWPDDGPDQVFILRAVAQVGRAKAGSAWAPELQVAKMPPALDPWSEIIDSRVAEEVADILRSTAPHMVPDYDTSKDGWHEAADWLSSGLWQFARGARELERRQIEEAKDKLASIQRELLGRLRLGSVKSYTRPVSGGAYEPFHHSMWNYEDWLSRFRLGQVDLENPFQRENKSSRSASFIFVCRQDLASVAAIAADLPDLAPIWEQLSPLMRIAIREAARIQTDGVEPSASDLMKRLKDRAAAQGADMSTLLAQKMVTMIRSPEAAKGVKQNKVSPPRRG